MGNEPSKKIIQPDITRWVILILLSIIISLFLNPGLMEKPREYKPGDIAEADIKAPVDLLVKNIETTEKERTKAAQGVPYVYDYDSSASNIRLRLSEAITEARNLVSVKPIDPLASPLEEEIHTDMNELKKETRKRFFRTLELTYDEKFYDRVLLSGCPPVLE
jgi:membrane-associated HD superfamily phosphohydrolase